MARRNVLGSVLDALQLQIIHHSILVVVWQIEPSISRASRVLDMIGDDLPFLVAWADCFQGHNCRCPVADARMPKS